MGIIMFITGKRILVGCEDNEGGGVVSDNEINLPACGWHWSGLIFLQQLQSPARSRLADRPPHIWVGRSISPSPLRVGHFNSDVTHSLLAVRSHLPSLVDYCSYSTPKTSYITILFIHNT